MAATPDRSNDDLVRHLSVDPPPTSQIAREKQGLDTHMPLSPQWLLKDPSSQATRSDATKISGNGEDMGVNAKKKDVFRASVLDGETGHRDRWRDDEREPNSGPRWTRWKETDKDYVDARKVEKWADDSKYPADGRRAPQERWGDSGNKEGNYDQRREGKWSTRWCSNDKESETRRDRWGDSGKESDASREKGFSQFAGNGKDSNTHDKDTERDDNISRSWKSSYPVGRVRGDSSYHPSQTSQKSNSVYAYGRGKPDSENTSFTSSRGKFTPGTDGTNTVSTPSSRPVQLGLLSDRPGGASRDRTAFRYSRMKLLDIYRSTLHVTDFKMPCDVCEETSAFIQEETLEPLALFAPTGEEVAILKSIDKGEIINSGVYQVSKDGKSNSDAVPPNQSKFGAREDQPGTKDFKGEAAASLRGVPGNADLPVRGDSLQPETHTYVVPQRSRFIGEHRLEPTANFPQQICNAFNQESKVAGMMGLSEFASPVQPHPNPESLSLYYKDPQGRMQGPFSGADIIGWFETGYFGIDLLVRVANAPPDGPFLLLGDVMPHLRAKARPPPGFSTAKSADALIPETASTGIFVSSSSTHPGSAGVGIFDSGPSRKGGAVDAQNCFLESLMSTSAQNLSAETISMSGGLNEYGGSSFGNITMAGGESGNTMNYLLAQKRLLERQTSSQNPVSYWSGDGIPAAQPQNKDIASEISTPHSKLHSPINDPSRQAPQSQNVDLLAMLHSAEKPKAPASNVGLPPWSNYPEARNLNPNIHGVDLTQGGLNIHQNLQNSQQIRTAMQQQNFMQQNQPSLAHLPPEKLLAEISQDPQLLHMLQQQYLFSQLQLQSQPPLTPPHQPQLSMLDKMMLLQQQQQQQKLQQKLVLEQQQKLLLQQQLLSQGAPHGHSNQQLDDPYGAKHNLLPTSDSGVRKMQEVLEVDQILTAHSTQQVQQSNQPSVDRRGMEVVGLSQSLVPTLPLPHEMFVGTRSKELYFRSQKMGNLTNSSTQLKASMVNQSANLQQEAEIDKTHIKPYDILGSVSTDARSAAHCEAKGFLETPLDPNSEIVPPNISSRVHEVKTSSKNTLDNMEATLASEVEATDIHETRKSEKKKKQKKKQAATDVGKGALMTSTSQQPGHENEVDGSSQGGTKHDLLGDTDEVFWDSPVRVENSSRSVGPPLGFESSVILPPKSLPEEYGIDRAEWEPSVISSETHATASQKGWKPTQGPRPKSLLEIQAEEQQRAERAALESAKPVVSATSVPSVPWNIMPTSSEQQFRGAGKSFGGQETVGDSRNKRSQLHDVLAEEVLARSNVDNENIGNANDMSFPPLSQTAFVQPEAPAFDDTDFIEAKDSKKNKKKAAKSKGSAVKTALPVGFVDSSAIVVPTEKKSPKQAQQEKEILPAPPSGPSFGDFVPWKTDQTNYAPAPAWSNDSAKMHKPLSLRDIQREEEKRSGIVQQQPPSPTPAKVSTNQQNHGNTPSWQASASSPSKAAAPVQTSSNASNRTKSNVEDDLFWGPSDHSKQDENQYEFPTLSSQSRNSMTKDQSVLNRQKPQASKFPLSPAPTANHTGKGKTEAANKQSEAMDFRDWCDSEWSRLTGTNDTSFLEFCIKQSNLEAETLLRENVGSLDRTGQFIDKFLNYKAFLSTEVIETAFRAPSNRSSTCADGVVRANHPTPPTAKGGATAEAEQEAAGWKKKGKKGKKVSTAVLGFNVVSNRIMMGEIQNVD